MQIVNPLLPVFTFPIPINLQEWKDITKGAYTDMLRDAPTRVSIRESKAYNTQRTLNNWVSAHWGENIPTMQVQGNIIELPGQEALSTLSLFILRSLYRLDKNNIINLGNMIISQITSIGTLGGVAFSDILDGEFKNFNLNKGIQSALAGYSLVAYIKRLGDLKQTDLAPTYILHDNNIYQGYFTDFQYTRDINDIRKISYSFNLNIEWNSANYLIDIAKNSSSLSVIKNIGII